MKAHARQIVLCIAISSCLWAGACSKPEPEPPEPPPAAIEVNVADGVLEAVDKVRPPEVLVYEALPGDPRKWLDAVSKAARIEGEPRETEELIEITSEDRHLEVRKASNAVFYGAMAKLWTEEPSPERSSYDVPSNEEAEKIAVGLLSEQLGFGPQATDLLLSVSDEVFEITPADAPDRPQQIVVGKNVEVRRRIGGLQVYGPGSKVKIYVGEGGAVNGYMAVWRQYDPASTALGHRLAEGEAITRPMETIAAERAFEQLRKNPLDHLPLALVHTIDVDRAEFGYYARSAAERQQYLQPVYVFSGTAHATLPEGKEVSVPYEQFVVALAEPLESIWPETREYQPQTRVEGEPLKVEEDEDEVVD